MPVEDAARRNRKFSCCFVRRLCYGPRNLMDAKQTQSIAELLEPIAEKIKEEPLFDTDALASRSVDWPVDCTVGPGLEGAIACETRVSYVHGAKGRVLYQGYDLGDLCVHSNFEEVSYLLLHGELPTQKQYEAHRRKLISFRYIPNTLRMLMSFPMEEMHPMAAMRLGVNLMRQRLTWRDKESGRPDPRSAIAADEDSIPMETMPMGEKHAIYEFRTRSRERPPDARSVTSDATAVSDCIHLISGMATICAAISRVREDRLPIEPDPELGHAANLLYMMRGEKPSEEEARIMDICLILHADHGINASTFASLVVASTLSDVYFSIGSGIAALSGPLHGGANEQVVRLLEEIGSSRNVKAWYEQARSEKRKIMGFGHRVYKTFDPRALLLGPLAERLCVRRTESKRLYATARKLEDEVVKSLGESKGIYPNVDFYSGLVYRGMGIDPEMFTPIFAVSRVAGWTARVREYLQNNRIFRPRSIYVGSFGGQYQPIGERRAPSSKA